MNNKLTMIIKLLVIVILASGLVAAAGLVVQYYGWEIVLKIFLKGLIFSIGLIFVAILAALVFVRRKEVNAPIWKRLSSLILTNNGRVVLVFLGMLLALSVELYQLNRVISPYMMQSPTKEVVTTEIKGRTETERSIYRFWDGNKEAVERVAKPKSLKSSWWFVRQSIVVIGLLLIGLIYFPISRIDEVKKAIRRVKQRLDEASGGVLKAEEPGFFERFKTWRERKVVSVAVAAPAVAVAGAPGVTVAATETGVSGIIAQTVKAIPEKIGFLKKYGHWLATIALIIEELFERRRKK